MGDVHYASRHRRKWTDLVLDYKGALGFKVIKSPLAQLEGRMTVNLHRPKVQRSNWTSRSDRIEPREDKYPRRTLMADPSERSLPQFVSTTLTNRAKPIYSLADTLHPAKGGEGTEEVV